MATGAGTSGVVAPAGGSVDGSGAGASPRFFAPEIRGAMIVFSILVESQAGQVTSSRLTWVSKAAEFWNQLSNACPLSHVRA